MASRKRLWFAGIVLVAAVGGMVVGSNGPGPGATRKQPHDTSTASERDGAITASIPTMPGKPIERGSLRLEGQVTDDHEQPIVGAKVTLAGARSTTTEADGSFAFDGLAAAEYTVAAELAELYAEDSSRLDDSSEPVILKLHRGPLLVVHVIEAQGGAPIANAMLKTSSRSGVTGADGVGQLRSIDTPYERIEITAPGHAPAKLSVSSGEDLAQVERTVIMTSGAPVSGTVVDGDGKPVADAHVMIETAGDAWEESTHTDDAGAWQLASIGPGKHAVHASSELHLETPNLVFEHDGVTPKQGIVLRVELGGQITGTVTDANGRSVAGAQVSTGRGSDTTDATGRFTVNGLPEDDYEVSATNETGVSPITNLKLARGAHADVKLVMVTSSISGKVADSHGTPIENAYVYASSKLTQRSYFEHTDARGHFNLGGVPPGDYEISAQRNEERSRDMPPGIVVTSGNHGVAFVLQDLGSISGRVILDGKPVRSFGFVVSARAEHTLFDTPKLVRGDTGRFTEPDIGPGTWGIAIVGPGFTRKVVEGIQVTAGAKVEVGDIVVERGRSISGHVRDARGAPVVGAMVGVYDHKSFSSVDESINERMQGNLFAHTDTAGRYQIDGLDPAATGQRIEATHALGVSVERELGAGETTVDLVVAATGGITGTITDMNPRQYHAIARPVDTSNASFRADIDAAGFFTFDRMPPGEYSVRILGRNTMGRRSVTVAAGQHTPVTFAMPRNPVTAVVEVTGGCRMVSVSSGDESRSTETCEQDHATLPGLAPGRYRACVDFDDCVEIDILPSPQRQVFTLHAAKHTD